MIRQTAISLAALAMFCAAPSFGAETDLVISEVLEGTSGNLKYVEIVNRGATPVVLADTTVTLRRYTNGAITVGASIPLVGTIPAGGRFVIANNQADLTTFMGGYVPSQISTNVNHNGNDGYDLVYGDTPTVIDTFAKDLMTGVDPTNFANDCVAFRILSALPNTGGWGAVGPKPADGANSASGFWKVVYVTATNGNALAVGTPGTGGGGGGVEVPVTLSQMTIE
jgi:hypothetical protein